MRFQQRKNQERRGVILLVVLSLLTLFAVVGISFVLYADAEATAARINKEAETIFQPNIDPELALSMFLGQLIYDAPDDASGVYSALRGQSLARSMYGWNPGGLNDKPYTGTGRLHYPGPLTGLSGYAADNSYLVNFIYYSVDNFLRDPERYGTRSSPTAAVGPYVGGFNVPYTYADHQNLFLGMMRSSDGTVLMPSFHRPWLFDPQNQGYPAAANWTNQAGKYLTCLVRPADMGAGFPTPDSNGLSVKNIDWSSAGNDSGWIDIGAPVMIASNGQKYKMLVAPLILELDSRINLNVVGNILGAGNTHASGAGWMGTSGINLGTVLNSQVSPQEWTNIFLGSPNTNASLGNPSSTPPRVVGRYGISSIPQQGSSPAFSFGAYPREYSSIDFNGVQGAAPNALIQYPMQLPLATPTATPPSQPYQCVPSFPQGFASSDPAFSAQLTNNPLIYNQRQPQGDNRLFPLSTLAALLRFGGTNSEALSSDLLRLCPQNFILDTKAPSGYLTNPLTRRNLVTLLSADLDRPGATPYIWDPGDQKNSTRYGQQFNPQPGANGLWTPLYPSANPIPFAGGQQLANPLPTPPNPTFDSSEFDPATWRSLLGQQLRVNLNRPLASYPAPYQYPYTISASNARFPSGDTSYQQAVKDRQQLALDIFTALRKAVGALPVATAAAAPYGRTSPDYLALRWLAQLAVNIVDFIDQDDINTPFQWDPGNTTPGDYGYVFGTELPRLVINEAFIQLDNDPNDPGVIAGTKATTHYNVNTWVELCNPLINGGKNAPAGDSANQAVLEDGTGSIYQLVIADPTQPPNGAATNIRLVNMRNPANVLGDPNFPNNGPNYGVYAGGTNVMTYGASVPCVVNKSNNGNSWGANTVVLPLNNGYSGPANNTQGFYVIGPPAGNSTTPTGLTPPTTVSAMTYWVNLENANPPGAVPVGMNQSPPPAPTILLQRLACPGLPFKNNPGGLDHNPYITVDYYEAFQQGAVYDSRQYNATGKYAPNAFQPYASWGRNQPYAATNSQWNSQNPNPAPVNQPAHTFFRHNAVEANPPPSTTTPGQTLRVPFDWLVHLDRQLISPLELLHVSAFKPHELTQQFYDPNNNNNAITNTPAQSHYAPWTNPANPPQHVGDQSRLYRFFELVETPSRANGVRMGGRTPGKININGVFDLETFQAVCDAQACNWFTAAEINNLFTSLVKQRSPTSDGISGFMPGANDLPFWGLATGYATGGDPLDPNAVTPTGGQSQRGILDTLLRNNTSTSPKNMGLALDPIIVPGATTVSPGHLYQHYELLNKIFNKLTTRSNVFAVWLTVGFFEVAKDANGNYVGDQSLPVKLGAEIGRAEGRQIRHRMFAIVDRSNLQAFSTTSTAAVTASTAPYTPQTVSLGTIVPTNPSNSAPALQAGMVLVYEPNTDNEETVVVQNNGGQLQATFQRAHASGVQVISRGNPGPWPRYNPRNDPLVVPYFAIID